MLKILIINTILIYFFTGTNLTAAEVAGNITGTIIDSENKKLPGASVVLQKKSESIKGDISNSNGLFILKDIQDGEYDIKISFVGYQTKIIESIKMNRILGEINLGNIILYSDDVNLPEIQILADKQFIQADLDKIIINVDQNLSLQGGSAIDVLQAAPQVNVDIEGNISLRGNQNVKILIDGRASGLSADNLLETIPASAIESIEIITNPSSKYEAEGSTGIINIITKKEKNTGINGLISGNAGSLRNYNGSLNLNYKANNVNYFASYNPRIYNRIGIFKSLQEITTANNINSVYQSGDFNRFGSSHSIKLGVDLKIDKNNYITTYGQFNKGSRNFKDSMLFLPSENNFIQSDIFSSLTDESRPDMNLDYTISHTLNFGKKNHEIITDFQMNLSENESISDYIRQFNLTVSDPRTTKQSAEEKGKYRSFILKSDYQNPLSNGAKLELGVFASRRVNDLDYKFYDYLNDSKTIDENVSNQFIYTETIIAAYLNYADKIDNFSYQLGLRSENTMTSGEQKTSNINTKINYFGLFPTLFLKYDFSQLNSLRFNYSRRLSRPWHRQLNPFVSYENPLNLRSGNPNLMPEYVNAYEISNLSILNSTTLTATLFYRNTNNSISRIRKPLDSIKTITTYENLFKSESFGTEAIWAQDVTKKIKFDISASYFKSIIKGESYGLVFDNSSFSWNAKFNSYLTIFDIVDLQFSANYSAPQSSAQGQWDETFWTDFGAKINLLDGNLRINFRISDPFNTGKWSGKALGENFYTTYYWKRQTREFFIGFQYRFNDYRRQKERTIQDLRSTDVND